MTTVIYMETSSYSGVMVSDGQSTYGFGAIDKSAEKIHKLNNFPCAIGFAGDPRISSRIMDHVSKSVSQKNYSSMREILVESYLNVLNDEFRRFVKEDLHRKFKKLRDKEKKKLMHEFEEDFSEFICFGYNQEEESIFGYSGDGMIKERDKYAIGNDTAALTSIEKSMRKYMRDDRKKIPNEKAVEIVLKALLDSESDAVSGEPNIVVIDKEKYLDFTSQQSMLLQRALILFEYDKISKKAKNNVFGRIVKDEEPYETVADDLFKLLPSKESRDLLFTRHL